MYKSFQFKPSLSSVRNKGDEQQQRSSPAFGMQAHFNGVTVITFTGCLLDAGTFLYHAENAELPPLCWGLNGVMRTDVGYKGKQNKQADDCQETEGMSSFKLPQFFLSTEQEKDVHTLPSAERETLFPDINLYMDSARCTLIDAHVDTYVHFILCITNKIRIVWHLPLSRFKYVLAQVMTGLSSVGSSNMSLRSPQI